MTWHGYWLPHIVDWAASILLGAALIPLLRWQLRQVVRGSLPVNLGEPLGFLPIEYRGKARRMRPSEAWKTIEAGAGVVLIGVLEYVTESTDVATWLEQLVPHPLVPLVPIVLGGALLTVRVFKHPNAAPASVSAPTLDEPALAYPDSDGLAAPGPAVPASSAATPPAVTPATEDAGAIVGSPVVAAAATVATDGATPAAAALPELRDPRAVQAVARTLEPADVAQPPTAFIPLPTR